ncbi:hypothetical protein LXL04_017048 [Taraxacum kok-saghyz]
MIHIVWKNPNSFRSHHLPSSPPSYHHPIAPSISPLYLCYLLPPNLGNVHHHKSPLPSLLQPLLSHQVLIGGSRYTPSASTCFLRILFHHPRTPPSLYRVHCEINVSLLPCHYLLIVKNMAKEAWVFVLINCQEYMLMFKMMHRSKASAKKERATAGVKWEITTSSNEHKQQSTVSTTQKASKTTATLSCGSRFIDSATKKQARFLTRGKAITIPLPSTSPLLT